MSTNRLQTQNLCEEADTLRYNVQSLSDLRDWLKTNAHLLCEIPEDLLPRVEVSVEIHREELFDLIEKKSLWLTVIFDVPKDETAKNALEDVFSLVRDRKTSLYHRFYHMPLSFVKWPLCTALLAHSFYSDIDVCTRYAEQAREKLSKYLPKFFPGLSLEILDTLATSGLLPQDKDTFIKFMFDSRMNKHEQSLPVDVFNI